MDLGGNHDEMHILDTRCNEVRDVAGGTPQAAVNGGGLILSGLWMRWGE